MKINNRILSGAQDVLCIQKEDGSIFSTSWILRFGSLKIFSSNKKKVVLFVNWQKTSWDVILSSGGQAYFKSQGQKECV